MMGICLLFQSQLMMSHQQLVTVALVGFLVPNEETGNAWHQAGIDNGGETCEGPPGIRDVKKLMGTNMYLAYLRDPSGNKICALKRMD
jgi:catechol 2,3-dioxygenase-like lactoylglutathione lyase family enzyme